MTCKIEYYFAAMKMQPTWTEALTAFPRSLDDFISTFKLENCWGLAHITDVQIEGFYKDDAKALDQMIQLRNKCLSGDRGRLKPGAVAASANEFDKAPVIVSGWHNYYYCGRVVGEAKLFGPKVPESIPGMCGPRHGPQCAACIITFAHNPVPCQAEKDKLPVFFKKCTDGLTDKDGKPLFRDDAARNLFAWYKIGLVRELRDLSLEAVVRNSQMNMAQKVAMIGIIGSLKAGTNPHWRDTAARVLETQEKETLDLRQQLASSRNRVAEILLRNVELQDEFSQHEDRRLTRIGDLEENLKKARELGLAQIHKLEEELKKVRQCDMLEMLSDLSERSVQGRSVTYVTQAAHDAGALAARLAEKAEAMRAAVERRAAAEATLAAKRAAAEVDPPNEYLCGIGFHLMRDPVIVETGQTYEREAIAQWLETHETCPLTGVVLAHKFLTPNVSLRKLIDGYVNDQVVPEERAAKRPRFDMTDDTFDLEL